MKLKQFKKLLTLIITSEPIDLAVLLSPALHAGASASKAGKVEYSV